MSDAAALETMVAFGASRERADLDEYSKDISFVNPVRPALVARPRNTEDVRKIVQLANETKTPLVPVSSGPPH